jgi:hypothetical protein
MHSSKVTLNFPTVLKLALANACRAEVVSMAFSLRPLPKGHEMDIYFGYNHMDSFVRLWHLLVLVAIFLLDLL